MHASDLRQTVTVMVPFFAKQVCPKNARFDSYFLKQAALHDLMHERLQSVIPVANLANDRVDLVVIGRSRRRTGGVSHEPLRQGAGELILVAEQQFLELVDIAELSAIGQHIGGVHLLALEVRHAAAIDHDPLAVAARSIKIAPAADDVETLKRKS